jgi:hypothetical protein
MFDDRGFEYVTNRLKIPAWVVRDICDIKPKEQQTSKNTLQGASKFLDSLGHTVKDILELDNFQHIFRKKRLLFLLIQ